MRFQSGQNVLRFASDGRTARSADEQQSAVRSGPLPKEEEYDRTGHKKIHKTLILRILPTGIAGLGGEGGSYSYTFMDCLKISNVC